MLPPYESRRSLFPEYSNIELSRHIRETDTDPRQAVLPPALPEAKVTGALVDLHGSRSDALKALSDITAETVAPAETSAWKTAGRKIAVASSAVAEEVKNVAAILGLSVWYLASCYLGSHYRSSHDRPLAPTILNAVSLPKLAAFLVAGGELMMNPALSPKENALKLLLSAGAVFVTLGALKAGITSGISFIPSDEEWSMAQSNFKTSVASGVTTISLIALCSLLNGGSNPLSFAGMCALSVITSLAIQARSIRKDFLAIAGFKRAERELGRNPGRAAGLGSAVFFGRRMLESSD